MRIFLCYFGGEWKIFIPFFLGKKKETRGKRINLFLIAVLSRNAFKFELKFIMNVPSVTGKIINLWNVWDLKIIFHSLFLFNATKMMNIWHRFEVNKFIRKMDRGGRVLWVLTGDGSVVSGKLAEFGSILWLICSQRKKNSFYYQ